MLAYVIAYKQAKGAGEVEIKLKKQAQKYLDSVDANTRTNIKY